MHGLSHKLEDQELQTYLFKHNIIILLETMKDNDFDVTIPTHRFWHFARNKQHSRAAKIEVATRGQHQTPKWVEERKMRLTGSTFGLVIKRKETTASHATFVKNTLIGVGRKDLSGIPAIRYGIQNEQIAISKYEEYRRNIGTPVKVLPSGLVVNPVFPWLGASPDGKVLDSDAGPGILEVKCSFSHRHISPQNACRDPNFFCELVGDKARLKRKHNYYFQVQGQLGICGVEWCDFIVYTEKGLLIERIQFQPNLWQEMLYIQHYIPVALKI